jgi:hypothetical protein
MLIDSIGPLCRNPSAYADPYQELQDILLRSYGLSASQRTAKWLDHPGLGNNKPSVLWDQLNALKPDSLEEVQTVLFLRKLPAYIRDRVNPGGCEDLHALVQWCDYIWENRSQDAVPRSHSPSRGSHRNSSHFRGKRPGNAKSRHCTKY